MAIARPEVLYELLGGKKTFGRKEFSNRTAAEAIRAGLPRAALDAISKHIHNGDELLRVLGISKRTLARQKPAP